MISGLLYLLAGSAIVYLFQQRRRQLSRLSPDMLPELNEEAFEELKHLMKTAFERMLYLGILFFPLAYSVSFGSGQVGELFFLALIALMFIANIIPRHKIARLLESHGLSVTDLKERGIYI